MDPAGSLSTSTGQRSNPFSSLSIWRDKVQADLVDLPQTSSNDFKLNSLLQHSRDCEQAVYGCLKDALCELGEAHAWGIINFESAMAERERLYGQSAQEISTDKHLMVELARDNGVLELYHRKLLRPFHHSVSDMETLGELRFGLMVWKANLHVMLSLAASNKQEQQDILAEGLQAALDLADRCIHTSFSFWSSQGGVIAPHPDQIKTVSEAAKAKIVSFLCEVARSHHIDEDILQSVLGAQNASLA